MTLRILVSFLLKAILFTGCTIDKITLASCDYCGTYSEDVATYIDVSSQLVNVKNIINVQNNLSDPVTCFTITIDPLKKGQLSHFEAKDSKEQPLSIKRLFGNSLHQFKVIFQNYILEGESNTISVYSIYTNCLQSYPRSVKQGQQHLVLFSFNVYFYSASLSNEQTTFVNLGTHKLLSVDGENYSSSYYKHGYLLKYGPYFDIPPFSVHLSNIHYTNKSPFLTVENLERNILLSHWGYANVWENVLLVHAGPIFVGPYERPTGQDSVQDTRIESFTTLLPKNAFNIYVKDDIGLIWSYDIHDQDIHHTVVTIRPRFVMYGGWKIQYEIGYTVAITEYLRHLENSYFNEEFHFDFPSLDIIFQNMVIINAQINIILPEGATFYDIYPYRTENISDIDIQKYCYFFDVICRELVSFKRYNLVEKHRSNFEMTYFYQRIFLLLKPLAISIYLLLIFMAFIVISRLKSHSYAYSEEFKVNKLAVKSISNDHNKKSKGIARKKKKPIKC